VDDPVAIVTGGAHGLGREIARSLAGDGFAVVVTYLRDQRAAERAVDEIVAAGGAALAVRADVSDELDVERLFDETAAAFGPVDVVVHAGAPGGMINRRAAFQLRRGGAIVTVSSAEPMTPELAHALRDRDITVNGVAPGLEPPGADHSLGELVGLVERWRRRPGE
jgi:3-oxoacyl-[acyl-carrier protein] reductase